MFWDLRRIKTFPRVSHHNQDAAIFVTSDAEFNLLADVFLAAMHDGISQRLAQRGFHFQLFPLGTPQVGSSVHDVLNHGRYGIYVCRDRSPETQKKFAFLKLARVGSAQDQVNSWIKAK